MCKEEPAKYVDRQAARRVAERKPTRYILNNMKYLIEGELLETLFFNKI